MAPWLMHLRDVRSHKAGDRFRGPMTRGEVQTRGMWHKVVSATLWRHLTVEIGHLGISCFFPLLLGSQLARRVTWRSPNLRAPFLWVHSAAPHGPGHACWGSAAGAAPRPPASPGRSPLLEALPRCAAPNPSSQARERRSPSDSGTAERAGVALTDGAGLRRGDGRRFASRPLSWSLNPEGSSERPLGGVRSLGRAGPPGHAHPRAHTAVPSPEAVTFHDSRGTPRRGRRVPPRLLCGSVQTRARLSPAPETVWPAWCPPPSPSSPFTHVLVSKAHLCGPLPSLP